MAAETRALLAGDAAVAALLLRQTLRLPVLVAGQCGSVPDLDAASAATIRRFVSDGGLAAAGGWGDWGADHLYSALELGMEQTAAALLAAGVQLAGTPPGGTCLHALAESTHAWDRPELVSMARRLTALGESLTALDGQQRTPLLVACQHRMSRMQARADGASGLDLLLALSSPGSTAIGAPMQVAAAQGDHAAVACMARGGGTDAEAMSAALPRAVAVMTWRFEVAALRLCGAAVPAGLVGKRPLVQDALSLGAEHLLLRYGLTFHRAVLLRILDRHAWITAPALAAAASAAGDPEALLRTSKAGQGGPWAAQAAQMAAWRVAAVLAREVRPFLLCMHRLGGDEPGGTATHCAPSKQRRGLASPPALRPLPGAAVDRTCVFLMLHDQFLD
ncbi:hypothetical protein ABPG77_004023 [Micractinium sp. CCAP 211/92]